MKQRNFFSLKASVLGLWVPSVVGKTTYTFKLVSMASCFARTLAFIIAWVLAGVKIAPTGAFLFYCVSDYEEFATTKYEGYESCTTIRSCLDKQERQNVTQKVRICSDDDQLLTIFGVWVILTGIISVFGTFLLHKMTSYEHLFKVSRSCCWIKNCPVIPFFTDKIGPTIHRNLIFTVLVINQDQKAAENLEEILECVKGDPKALEAIICRPLEGETALIYCIKQNMVKCVNLLLASGAKIEANCDGEFPLDIAVKNGDVEIVELLLEKDSARLSKEHPINLAVRNKDVNIVRFLLDKEVEVPEGYSEHPIEIAVKNKDSEILTLLLDHGLRAPASAEDSLVVIAVKNSDGPVLKSLLHHGVEIHENKNGEHPLNIAVNNDDKELVTALLVRIIDMKDNMLEENIHEITMGTIHTVYNQTLLLNILENSSMEEELKGRILQKLAKVMTIPHDNLTKDKRKRVEALIQHWNTNQARDARVHIGNRKVMDKDHKEYKIRSIINDKELSNDGQNPITCIKVKWVDGWYIHSLTLRYSNTWGKEHIVAKNMADKDEIVEKNEVKELTEGAEISEVRTKYDEQRGSLAFLQIKLSSGEIWTWDTGFTQQKTKTRDVSETGRKLAFLSSAKCQGGRYQTVFHWI